MTDIFINKAKAVSVSGHRYLLEDFNRELIKKIFISLIENNYDTFLIGMAIGFDTECFKILEELRNEYPIKIIACVPCLSQSANFNKAQKEEYDRMMVSADEKVILQDNYDKYCMLKRNDYMLENSSLLVAYLRKKSGGTAYTVRRATEKNVDVIKI